MNENEYDEESFSLLFCDGCSEKENLCVGGNGRGEYAWD